MDCPANQFRIILYRRSTTLPCRLSFKYLPDASYTRPLVSQLTLRLEASHQPSGPTLSQAIWAMATLGIKPSEE